MHEGTELAGRYRLLTLLGRGGMGQVWQAEDLRLGRLVAVKLLLGVDLPDDSTRQRQILARFHREGHATAKLTHRNIAAAFDVGEHKGRPFLVLELLHGRDLRTVLEQDFPQGMPMPLAADYGAQVAEALAAAHAVGIVHRDIKPANLMLLADGTVKVCDFGIARLRQSVTEPQLTQAGMAIGTPAYMPPEQFQGKPVDAAADVYALGATLFHLLTGRLVFPATEPAALYAMHAGKQAPQVSSLRTDASPELDALIGALLAKDPRRRPDAADAAARLRRPGVRAIAPAGRRARIDIDEAVRVARLIGRDEQRVRTLVNIAEAAAVSDPEAAKALLVEAEQSARADPQHLYSTLATIARAVTEHDPRHAALLLSDAEHLIHEDARQGSDHWRYRGWQASALSDIAGAWAALDPDRAEKLARLIRDPDQQAAALRDVAVALATSRPRQSEALARAITGSASTGALSDIARALAAVDLEAGVRVARMIPSRKSAQWIGELLVDMAAAAAATDPYEAERIAETLVDPRERDRVLCKVASVVAVTDFPYAMRIAARADKCGCDAKDGVVRAILATGSAAAAHFAATIPLNEYNWYMRPEVCRALAATDPDAAERLARSMPASRSRAAALRNTALALTDSDPVRAQSLLSDAAEDARGESRWACRLASIAAAMAKVNQDHARALVTEAEQEARKIKARAERNVELLLVAEALAAIDPAAAERLLRKLPKWIFDLPYYECLRRTAAVVASCDPGTGERIARRIKHRNGIVDSEALISVAVGAATVDLPAARRIADGINKELDREKAWAGITAKLLTVAPDIAVGFAWDLADFHATTADERLRRRFPLGVLELVASVDPAAAQHIAVTTSLDQDKALAAIAEIVAGIKQPSKEQGWP
ncbi:protein kinase [Streptomyces cacaoi]|uniref:serine/threonine-protein kinase n=1 Tax=Streptomyces cacaoi TaxID=1898 RepID=UPI00374A1C78